MRQHHCHHGTHGSIVPGLCSACHKAPTARVSKSCFAFSWLPERPWAGLALPRTWVKFNLLAEKEAFTRSCFSASFPICVAFSFNKWRSTSEIPKCQISVGIKPTLKKAKLEELGHCSLGPVAILDMISRALADDLTDKD